MSKCHPSFEFLGEKTIDTLKVTVQHYRHKATGAEHYHLATDNDENVFLVGLRTVPMDSTGVAHILEHTTLCGSEKYPVRDPFFMMLRRSLNTFMNAFTSSDWTAYPFATQNRKDYFNLLSVYLDAVFFPRLDALDFSQEGHRMEFEDPKNPDSELVYKGVVFNEMKGAMSSPTSQLWHRLTEHLYPTTTYHFNSGGEPEDIPTLSHEQLLEFHRSHYHPSNAIFLTFGDIPAQELQTNFEEQVLAKFVKSDDVIKVEHEKRLKETNRVEEPYSLDDEDIAHKTHIVMGWLLGESTDIESMLEAHFLSGVLLDNSAAPLRAALEQTELAKAPSPMCGLEDSNHEMCFLCGVDGSEPEKADQVEKLILDTLETIAKDGVDFDLQEAILHQLEFEQREIGGASYPYGLQLILQLLPTTIHRGDALNVLDIDPHLERLRKSIQDPNFVKGLVKKNLLDNPHRVRLSLTPDRTLSKQKLASEKSKLAAAKTSLDEPGRQAILEKAQALGDRQKQKDDPNILPKVTPNDIPAYKPLRTGRHDTVGGMTLDYYAEGTNGIVYQTFAARLPKLTEAELLHLPLFVALLDELGAGEDDYQTLQLLQSQYTGGLGASVVWHAHIDDPQLTYSDFLIGGKALTRHFGKLNELIQHVLYDVRFDETKRISEVIDQIKASAERRITQNGHTLAMTAACSEFSPIGKIAHQEHGLKLITTIRDWEKRFKEDTGRTDILATLVSIHQKLANQRLETLLIGEEAPKGDYLGTLANHLPRSASFVEAEGISLEPIRNPVRQAWTTTTEVNFCAKAFPTVPSTHPDAAKLTVLGSFLRNGFLHTTIREQGGAYGGGAGHDSEIGAFRFYSYRDPRLAETLDDFDKAINWLQDNQHEQESLDEAILSVIASMDKPSSPAGEARKAYFQKRYGRTDEHRKAYREGVLNTSLEDLKRVGATYLKPDSASIAVLTQSDRLDKVKHLELEHFSL